jgi:hypothetical protein
MNRYKRVLMSNSYSFKEDNTFWIIDLQRPEGHGGKNGLVAGRGKSLHLGWFYREEDNMCSHRDITVDDIVELSNLIRRNPPSNPLIKEYIKEFITWWVLK